jgi:hypothetical protein
MLTLSRPTDQQILAAVKAAMRESFPGERRADVLNHPHNSGLFCDVVRYFLVPACAPSNGFQRQEIVALANCLDISDAQIAAVALGKKGRSAA